MPTQLILLSIAAVAIIAAQIWQSRYQEARAVRAHRRARAVGELNKAYRKAVRMTVAPDIRHRELILRYLDHIRDRAHFLSVGSEFPCTALRRTVLQKTYSLEVVR